MSDKWIEGGWSSKVMPNWTDDEGRNHFGKLDCKRCLQTFDANEVGEIPIHKCHGGYYKSGWDGFCHHAPIKISDEEAERTTTNQKRKRIK